MATKISLQHQVAAGLGGVALICAATSLVAARSLESLRSGMDRLVTVEAQNVLEAERVHADVERLVSNARAFLLLPEEHYASVVQEMDARVRTRLDALSAAVNPEDRAPFAELRRAIDEHNAVAQRIMKVRQSGGAVDGVAKQFTEELRPRRERLKVAEQVFLEAEQRHLDQARERTTQDAVSAGRLVIATAALAILAAAAIAVYLSRTLTRRISSAIQNIQSSSTELQAAATQQAAGTVQQASTATEVNTTIRELLATSRQIAESAQRVSRIAAETASSAQAGDQTVERAQAAIATTQKHVEGIVTHMLELGRKSQQIGGILELINELAEQTNILAINATIESAGAGESGKRFAVVAEEIRKLADRVGGSTREIRVLVDEIRGSTSSTVMATENGSKAVEAGARQFSEVTQGFKQISRLVQTTSEAAREIEISTKQQATAVEQVNVAISNVAQAARESEVSTKQTLQTSAELAALSRELTRLIHPNTRA